MTEAYKILKKASVEPDRDEYALYGEILVNKLRGLNEETREIAMHEIDNYLFSLKHAQNNSQTQTLQPQY